METRLKGFTQFVNESAQVSENLQYHLENGLSITESVFRPGSEAHVQLLTEARDLFFANLIYLNEMDAALFVNTDLGKTSEYAGQVVPLDLVLEAEYNGKKVEIGKPMRGGETKKDAVYVMNPSTNRVKKIAFGDVKGGLTAKVSNPKARKSFAARHNCKEKTDRMSAGYWACRINRYAHLWGGKTYPGFW
jgi:hypothetical protein